MRKNDFLQGCPECLSDMVFMVAIPLAIKQGYELPVSDNLYGFHRACAEMFFFDYLDHGQGD